MPASTISPNVKHKYEESGIDAEPIDVSVSDKVFGTVPRSLLIGTAGAVEVTTLMGRKVIIPAVPAGILPLCVKAVHTAGTSAQNITAIY